MVSARSEWVIYAIRSEHLVKVGITADLKSRMKLMELFNPMPFKCIRFSYVPRDRARKIEMAVHAMLSEHHKRREWFEADDEKVITVINDVLAASRQGERQWAKVDNHPRLKETIFSQIGT